MEILSSHGSFDTVKIFLKDKFSGNPEFSKTLFILGYQNFQDIDALRAGYPGYRIIVFQLEQLDSSSSWCWLLDLPIIHRCDEVWDYDMWNIGILESKGIKARHVPLEPTIGMVPKIINQVKDIDVLFYGWLCPRRMEILSSIATMNHSSRISVVCNVWGLELDELISRSRIVLNLHAYEGSVQEQPRLIHLIASGATVFSEKSRVNYFGSKVKEFEKEMLPYAIKGHLSRWHQHS